MLTTVSNVLTQARARDLIALTKPRLSTLVMVTAGGGIWLAPGELGWARAWLSIVATALLVAAANSLNCYLERDTDALMRRTHNRPLPSGRLDPRFALLMGWGMAPAALLALGWAANPLTALLGAVAFFSYVFVYTPMKRISPLALFVGAVPGAMPPLMGYTAVTGFIDFDGLVLFGLLFTWQLPHFLAISYYLKEDYARGGLLMFCGEYGESVTKAAIVITTVLLVKVSLIPAMNGMAGLTYGVIAGGLGAALLALSLAGLSPSAGAKWARRMFLGSTLHLTLLFAALMAVGSWK